MLQYTGIDDRVYGLQFTGTLVYLRATTTANKIATFPPSVSFLMQSKASELTARIEKVVDGLLDGRQAPEDLISEDGGCAIAAALAERIDGGHVQPSRAAHAMCGSAANGSYAVVAMLSERPPSTFNKAYNFSEPLRRACRSWARVDDFKQRHRRLLCAAALVRAGADLDAPDKYLKSKQSARQAVISIKNKEYADEFFRELDTLTSKVNVGYGLDASASCSDDAGGRKRKRK